MCVFFTDKLFIVEFFSAGFTYIRFEESQNKKKKGKRGIGEKGHEETRRIYI